MMSVTLLLTTHVAFFMSFLPLLGKFTPKAPQAIFFFLNFDLKNNFLYEWVKIPVALDCHALDYYGGLNEKMHKSQSAFFFTQSFEWRPLTNPNCVVF